jgi:sporulation integral membrane protein YlbJ
MKKQDTLYQLLFTALSLYLIFLMLRYPALSLEYASTGLTLWFTKMVPTLLPFMILSGIMIRMNLTERFVGLLHPLLHRIYGTSRNGSYTIIMGFLCGFPMGARIVGELYEQHKLSREESALLLSFCNNIGPIYFLSYVIPTLGIDRPGRPFLLMYGIPLLYGFLLMRIRPMMTRTVSSCENHPEVRSLRAEHPGSCSLLAAIDASVLSGLIGIARLGGYMVFFNLLNIVFQPFQHVNTNILNIYRCLLEITSGIDYSGRSINFAILILLPFGGFSCIAQTYSMIRQTDLSLRPYLYHKAVQTAITAACYLLLYLHGLTP